MRVKFWGCRGSIPVPDSRMMKYGGNTTCVEVTLRDHTLIIDAGTGIRKLGDELMRRGKKKFDLFITHSHWDHIQGFPFFAPIYDAATEIRVLGCTNSYKQLKSILADQMSYEYFPVSFADLKSKIDFSETGGITFGTSAYRLSFIDANHPTYTAGIRIDEGSSSFVFITDNELRAGATSWEDMVSFARGSTYLVHDAQFTEEEYPKRGGWGHSTFEQVLALGRDAAVGHVGFTHHDPSREDTELDAIAARVADECRRERFTFTPFIVKEGDEIRV
jgi:phosphoribosyl 1,2-cyclic phosphodiesterase